MPINANLLGAMARPVRSVADYQDDYARQDMQQQGLQRNALLLQEGQALQQDRERARMDGDTLRNALSMLPPGATHEQRISAMEGTNLPAGYTQADALRKAISQQAKDAEEVAGKAQKRGIEGDQQARLLLQAAQNPTMAADMVRSAVDQKLWTPERGQSVLDGMPIDLTQWDTWRNRQLAPAQAPKDLLPRQGVNNSGGFDNYYSQNTVDGTVTINSRTERQQTPGEVARIAEDKRQFGVTSGLAAEKFKYEKQQDTTKATAPPKPLPAPALKMQQESLDAIGIASSINADLAGIEKQIGDGKLSFGPVSNLVSAGLNAAGQSTEKSRNFARFKSTLERLRNESLRLNAGVQTDGDAQRAWAELFQNINDTDLVKQRLGEIQNINKRGTELHLLRVDSVRSNYGAEPLDTAAYSNQPAAVGATPKPGHKPTGKTVKRTGTSGGRKVVEYTDGSIEYAD